MTRLAVILLLMLLVPRLASAKRTAPINVAPVIYEGIRYVAPNDDGRRGYIEAWDNKTDTKLWELTIFINRIDPSLEEDVQWFFIKALSVQEGRLIVTSERGGTYSIDLKTKAIIPSDPESSPAPSAAAQHHDIPEAVESAVRNGSLAKDYEISFHLDPFYLRGDFNGEGKSDFAVLVKERSTGKIGIAIIRSATGKATILGAGIPIGNGGDDFEWMDNWEVYSKQHKTSYANAPRFRGDALFVGKSEAASALIYWNGKRYVWLQQGD